MNTYPTRIYTDRTYRMRNTFRTHPSYPVRRTVLVTEVDAQDRVWFQCPNGENRFLPMSEFLNCYFETEGCDLEPDAELEAMREAAKVRKLQAEYISISHKITASQGSIFTSAWHALTGAAENADLDHELYSAGWYRSVLGGFEFKMNEYPADVDPWTRNVEDDALNATAKPVRARDPKTGRYVKASK